MNIAIIGIGNLGECIISLILKGIGDGKLTNIDKIFWFIKGSDSFKKAEAKKSDQMHAMIIASIFGDGLKNFPLDCISDKLICTDDYTHLSKANIIVTCYSARKPVDFQKRLDLVNENNKITIDIAKKIKMYASKEVYLINLVNPVDVITWQLQELSGLPHSQVIGVSGIVDVSRFAEAIHHVLNIKYKDIDLKSLIVLGEHDINMVPLLSHAKIFGGPLLKKINEKQEQQIIHDTKNKGIKIMNDLDRISAHHGPAEALQSIIQALSSGKSILVPCCSWSKKYQTYIGLLVKINHFTHEVQPIAMTESEENRLEKGAVNIKDTKRKLPTNNHFENNAIPDIHRIRYFFTPKAKL